MDQKKSIVREEGSVDNRILTTNPATRNHLIGGSRERTLSRDRNTVFTASMMTRTSVSGLKTTMAAQSDHQVSFEMPPKTQ